MTYPSWCWVSVSSILPHHAERHQTEIWSEVESDAKERGMVAGRVSGTSWRGSELHQQCGDGHG